MSSDPFCHASAITPVATRRATGYQDGGAACAWQRILTVFMVAVLWPWFSPVAVLAAPPDHGAVRLTLAGAYQLARDHVATLSASTAEREMARANGREHLAAMLPQLSVNAYENLTEDSGLGVGPDERLLLNGGSLVLTQPLFRPELMASYREAQTRERMALERYRQAEIDLMATVSDAYFNVLIAQETLTAAVSQIEAVSDLLAAASDAYAAGQASSIDVDEIRSRYYLALSDQILAKNELDLHNAAFLSIIGERAGKLPGLDEEADIKDYFSDAASGDQPDWEAMALENSPLIRIAQGELQAASEGVARNRASRLPGIDLVASSSVDRGRYISSNGVALSSSNSLVGVQMSMPLYTGGAMAARVRAAAAERDQKQYRLADLRRNVLLDVRQAQAEVKGGYLLMQNNRRVLRASAVALDSTLDGFDAEIRNSLDVLNAQLQLFEADRNYSASKYKYLADQIRLRAAAGILEPRDLMELDEVFAGQG